MADGVSDLLGFLDTDFSVVKTEGQAHADFIELGNFKMMFGLFGRIDPAEKGNLKGQGID